VKKASVVIAVRAAVAVCNARVSDRAQIHVRRIEQFGHDSKVDNQPGLLTVVDPAAVCH